MSSRKPLKKLPKFELQFLKIHDIFTFIAPAPHRLFSMFRPQNEKLSWSSLIAQNVWDIMFKGEHKRFLKN